MSAHQGNETDDVKDHFDDIPIIGLHCKKTRSSATAEKQRVSCPHGGG